MKWRCTWCGKPHERNDPPCDSCGHGTFEEAIVREEDVATVDTGIQYVWVCSNCGRQHVRNNPPCARCGGHDLEKTEQTYEDVESDLDVPGWLEVARPYAPVIVVLGVVLVLFGTGVVSPSILPGIGPPTLSDAPGASDEAAGFDLESLEADVHERLENEREAAGVQSRPLDAGLGGIAEYRNQQDVLEVAGESRPADPDPRDFDPSCTGTVFPRQTGPLQTPVDAYEDRAALADDVTRSILASSADAAMSSAVTAEGIDVHVYEGTVYVAYAFCHPS